MVHPELTQANSFLAFSVDTNREFSCMDGSLCLLCMFLRCRHLYLCGGSSGVCVCVCELHVCVHACMHVCVHSTALHGTVVDVANPCTTKQ